MRCQAGLDVCFDVHVEAVSQRTSSEWEEGVVGNRLGLKRIFLPSAVDTGRI